MTTVFFVRHAEPNYKNHNDRLRELSPKGLRDKKGIRISFTTQLVKARTSGQKQE